MRNAPLNEAVTAIRAAGFEPHLVRNKHWKVFWLDEHGRRRCIVMADTSSDWRAQANMRSTLRRLLKP
jgi:hypothetical protein